MAKQEKPKEEQQRRVLEYQHFDMVKFKIAEEKATVKYYDFKAEHTVSPPEFVHPDMHEKLDQLKLIMADCAGLLEGWNFAREHLKKDPDALKLAMEGHKEAVARCKPNGFIFQGEGETRGVQITGSIMSPKKGSMGLSIPKVTFGKTVFGIEDDLEQICEEIKSEVYQYLFQQKKAQLDIETEADKAKQAGMFDDENEDEQEPEKKPKKTGSKKQTAKAEMK